MDRSCFNCVNLNYVKETFRGDEPVCNLQAKNFNEETYQYEDIACECSDYDIIKVNELMAEVEVVT